MKVSVPKEIVENEQRVALNPDAVARLTQRGMELLVESGAGEGAFYQDQDYEKARATIIKDTAALYIDADVVLKVQPPVSNETLGRHEVELMAQGGVLIAFLQPLINLELMKMLATKKITSFSMDAIPRIARAQKMDALSSMSSLAGYKAALIAADSLERYFPMMITAAGTTPPSKGLVLGAGVAGLQAIATARRLGAVVEAFDVRPVVKEQVESLGATFIQTEELTQTAADTSGYATQLSQDAQQRERNLIHKHVAQADFVITTALVPGKPAPVLVTRDMVNDMRPGSVIVDISTESGGNCELSKPGEVVMEHGVSIHGPLNLPSAMATHASQMYSRNVLSLLEHLVKDGHLIVDTDDAITQSCCITHEGHIIHGPTLEALG